MLDEESITLSPLPDVLSKGLVAVSTFGLLSFFCSTTLFLFLTWRLISWRWKSGFDVPTNQFLILIYNLLFADIQQAMAFLLNINSLRHNGIMVGTTTCWAQGWFVSTGDLASSVFISAIAVHTFFGVVKDYRPPTWLFWSCISACWAFVYIMGIIGPIMHGKEFFVRASAWCWINHEYSAERLWLHYFWIFVAMFSTILMYAFIVFFLRSKSRSENSSNPTVHGATPLMILYPLIYTVCTAPLAGGRIYALGGHHVSLAYFCVAGTMISCNGWLDVLLYASTRADIVFSEYPPGQETGLETFAFMGKGHRLGTVTTIQAGGHRHERNSSRLGISKRTHTISDSAENLYDLNVIAIKGEVSVSVDAMQHGLTRQDRIRNDSSGNVSRGLSWDERSIKSAKSGEIRKHES